MTIGNIPKEIRRRPSLRAYVLLAYLPTSSLEHIKCKESRRRCRLNLYHACMTKILSPLAIPGRTGTRMVSGDGIARRGHPLYACFIGDYPEQNLVTCTYKGKCPSCPERYTKMGDMNGPELPFRLLYPIIASLRKVLGDNGREYRETCKEFGMKPVVAPFWEYLPYAHVYRSITPDILHQLYQGVLKHIISWVIEVYGAYEIDAQCRRMPPNHNIHLFLKGISLLSRVTGTEHVQMCQILLGLIMDIPIAGQPLSIRQKMVRAVRGILDFLYLARYPVHTKDTLAALNHALQRFHDNKDVFIDVGVREHFYKISKLHFTRHYVRQIVLFGTTDNFNTEYTERLHIDLAKDAYNATNQKDEFHQMTIWLERREKIARHEKYIAWCLQGRPPLPRID